MATGLLESMDYKGGGLLERTHCTIIGRAKRAPHCMGCSIEISRDIYNYVHVSVVCQINCVGGIT